MTRQAHTDMLDDASAPGWRRQVADRAAERATQAASQVSLVRLAQHGDEDAFDALARTRIDRKYRLAFAILRSEWDARDAVQEAFVSAWRRLPGLRDPAHFDAWLDRIVVNACRMALRHRRVLVREIVVGDAATISSALGDGTQQPGPADDLALADVVQRAMQRLNADQRSILVLHHVEDRPVDEIAVVLGIPGGTVKWRLHAARDALRQALEEESR